MKKSSNQRLQKNGALNGKLLVKQANYYFDKNPTYLKDTETGEMAKINLKRCVEGAGYGRIPYFGYPLLEFDHQVKVDDNLNMVTCLIGFNEYQLLKKKRKDYEKAKDLLPFKPVLQSIRKEDRVNDHILKCFTYGKKIRRQFNDNSQENSRVDILKSRFQRLSLLREYFSINKKHHHRKFKFPIDEQSLKLSGKPLEIYDELQYCHESDIEIIEDKQIKKIREPDQNDKEEAIRNIFHQRAQSLDNGAGHQKSSRLDLIKKQSDSSSNQQSQKHLRKNSKISESTFRNLDAECESSLYSSPRNIRDKELLAQDRYMPFDFITQRKAKQFFNEPLFDIDDLLHLAKHKLDQNLNFEEAENHKEIPELNKNLKQKLQIIPPSEKLRPFSNEVSPLSKSHYFSSSDDGNSKEKSPYQKYKYGQKVQNTQQRGDQNEVLRIFFNRSQVKNHKNKKQILERIAKFKQNIKPEALNVLQNRQFVIVDAKSVFGNKKLNQNKSPSKSQLPDDENQMSQSKLYLSRDYSKFIEQSSSMLMMSRHQSNTSQNTIEKTRNENSFTPMFMSSGNAIHTQMHSETNFDVSQQTANPYSLQTPYQLLTNDNSQIQLPQIQANQIIIPLKRESSSFEIATPFDVRKQSQTSISKVALNTQTDLNFNATQTTNANSNLISKFGGDSMLHYQNMQLDSQTNNLRKSRMPRLHSPFSITSAQNLQTESPLPPPPALQQVNNFMTNPSPLTQEFIQSPHLDKVQSSFQPYENLNQPKRKQHSLINARMIYRLSPYQDIQNELVHELPCKKSKEIFGLQKSRIRGYLIDKIKKKSVLNCDLFKHENLSLSNNSNRRAKNSQNKNGFVEIKGEHKTQAQIILDQLNSVLGVKV